MAVFQRARGRQPLLPDVSCRTEASWWKAHRRRSTSTRSCRPAFVVFADAGGERSGRPQQRSESDDRLEPCEAGRDAVSDHARSSGRKSDGRAVTGDIFIEASPGRALPPLTIHGAGGWVSGYVVPVMSGRLSGTPCQATVQTRNAGRFRRWRRLSRSQLGILEGCVVAMGTGSSWRSLARVWPHSSAGGCGRR